MTQAGEEHGPSASRHAPAAEPTAGPVESGAVDGEQLAGDLRRLLLVSSRLLRSHTASEDISVSQFSVLAYLDRAGKSTPGALAAFEHVSPPVMTRLLGRLETSGLVRRDAHPGDGRQVRVSLTPAGSEAVARGRNERDRWLRGRIEAATEQERQELRSAVGVLGDVLLDPER